MGVCVARSMAISWSLSCSVTYAVVLFLSIMMWLGVLPAGMRLTSFRSKPFSSGFQA
ncbi:hypothetical protein D3C78_1836120 [compost metagenome]